MRRTRLFALGMTALLGAGVLSGCDENIEAGKITVNQPADDGDADDAPAPEDADSTDAPEPDDANDNEGSAASLDPDDSEAEDVTDPASSQTGDATDVLYEGLPTTLCPIDIPAPFTPHHMDSEEPGDGSEVFCIAHVSSKGDPVYLYEDITEQFKAINAEQLEDSPAVDPYDAADISIQTWLTQGHEIIVNLRYAGPTGVELTYVVRSPR